MSLDLQILPDFRHRIAYLYVEHAHIERDDKAVAIWDDDGGKTHLPVASIGLLMLGPGTKISHAAVDTLARNACLISWVGEEGVRLYAFGKSGTSSSARHIKQAELVSNPDHRMRIARRLYAFRFPEALSEEHSMEQLRGKEGIRVRTAYETLARQYGIDWRGRRYHPSESRTSDVANRALSVANACLYGVCHAAILTLGFSPALGFIHTGKQLSFVYDIADLYKLELAVPVAFEQAAQGPEQIERRVRLALRDKFRETRFVATVAEDLIALFADDIDDENLQEDKADDDDDTATSTGLPDGEDEWSF